MSWGATSWEAASALGGEVCGLEPWPWSLACLGLVSFSALGWFLEEQLEAAEVLS